MNVNYLIQLNAPYHRVVNVVDTSPELDIILPSYAKGTKIKHKSSSLVRFFATRSFIVEISRTKEAIETESSGSETVSR